MLCSKQSTIYILGKNQNNAKKTISHYHLYNLYTLLLNLQYFQSKAMYVIKLKKLTKIFLIHSYLLNSFPVSILYKLILFLSIINTCILNLIISFRNLDSVSFLFGWNDNIVLNSFSFVLFIESFAIL